MQFQTLGGFLSLICFIGRVLWLFNGSEQIYAPARKIVLMFPVDVLWYLLAISRVIY